MELLMEIDIRITDSQFVAGHTRDICMIEFGGTAAGPYFNGEVIGTGVDTQKIEKTKEMLLRYGIKRNIHVIPPGLDVERFDQDKKDPARIAQIKEEFGFLPEDTIVLFMGRIAKEKAIDLVIDGFGEIKLQGRIC